MKGTLEARDNIKAAMELVLPFVAFQGAVQALTVACVVLERHGLDLSKEPPPTTDAELRNGWNAARTLWTQFAGNFCIDEFAETLKPGG